MNGRIAAGGFAPSGSTTCCRRCRCGAHPAGRAGRRLGCDRGGPPAVGRLPGDDHCGRRDRRARDTGELRHARRELPRGCRRARLGAAAARAPLELGGKSPAIIDDTADLDYVANYPVRGKIYNHGQTCPAVDYVAPRSRVRGSSFELGGTDVIHPPPARASSVIVRREQGAANDRRHDQSLSPRSPG